MIPLRHRTATSTILLAAALAGCAPTPPPPTQSQPFVFRKLNLRRQDLQGRPLWELSSPETRYDLSRKLAQSRDLTGVLYEQGKPLYRFSAASGVVLNEGELVQLEGPIRLERLDRQRPLLLTGLRLRWYPDRELMEIDRAPKASSGDMELTAGVARFLIDKDRLELRGRPMLRQGGPEPLQLSLGDVDWIASSGDLRARGPVRGQRRLRSGAFQQLSSPGLTGSTTAQTLDLQAPVRLVDPSRQAVMEAQATRLELQPRVASSSEPFQARHGKARLSGVGFRLDLIQERVLVQADCDLRQPGEQLQARRCLWSWGTGRAEASGDVVLRREANGLTTRAGSLQGRIGRDGFAQFSSPGGRVRTEVRLPGGGGQPGADPFRPGRERNPEPTPVFRL